MEIVKKNLIITFMTGAGKEMSLAITNPKADLTPATVKASMTGIVTSNSLGAGSPVVGIQGAKYVIQQEDKLDLPA